MNTEFNSTAAALALNARPHNHVGQCQACGARMLALVQCLKGSNITNWARWFQKCPNCEFFFWHNTPTALEHIPDDVQINFVLVASSKEAGTSLLCPEPNCMTSNKQPRRANRECARVPPRCSACCKAAGGCNTQSHRLTHRDVPLLQVASTSSASGSSSSLDSTSGDPAPSAGSRTFARPLDKNYARGYLVRHHNVREANARLEATAKAKEASTNSVYVVLWAKEDRLPQKYTLVNETPGKFVPAEHLVLSSALVGGFISYLESPLSQTWCIRDARVPIPAPPRIRILLRTVDISDAGCLDMEVEISRLIIEQSGESGPIKIRRLLSLSGASTASPMHPSPSSSRQSSPDPSPRIDSSEPAVTTVERPIAPLRFPLTWACDMDTGLSVLRSSRTGTSQASLESAFKMAFPQCSFKAQTVYKHLKIYDDAVKLNILPKFSSAGKTTGGKWNPIVISDNDDDDHDTDYNIMTMKKEVFKYYSAGRMKSEAGSETEPALEMNVLICDKFEKGHKMKVAMGSHSDSSNDFILVALKKFTISDTTLWLSRDMAGWCEGARLAECQLQYSVFKSRAALINMDCAGVDVLPTCLFTCMGVPYITQPWGCGVPFSINTLARESGAYNILTAFSHFTYQDSNHRSVYVDFQGFQTTTGYQVFDSRTHILDRGDSTSDYPLFESLGIDGINHFVENHVCGPVCKALGLTSIPLEFPSLAPAPDTLVQSTSAI
ncbi:hypothetical protein C8R44DRAFT_746404 [Mycena epipterygia]|nr:hypothetical protein C8R44DRAFT_746404 [Mycena epipterygia]